MDRSSLKKFIWNSRSRTSVLWMLRSFPVDTNRVICISWAGADYNCNPRAIAEKLVDDKKWKVYFAFQNPQKYKVIVKPGINIVEIGSLKYYYLIATSKFVISNIRFAGYLWPYKKRGQKYIQTMHGGHGIKKIEFDVEGCLDKAYIETAKEDTRRTDLMLSDSRYWTNIYHTAFRYTGEIIEKGLPRNDKFLSHTTRKDSNEKYLLYTPTFRVNRDVGVYCFMSPESVDKVIEALTQRFGGEWYIRISSHPNMKSYYKTIYCLDHPRVIDVGEDSELQNLMKDSDVLLTDYSSAEMDFSLLKRPVFQLCKDRQHYDRGFYINPEELPFPYAENEEQLIENILSFDNDKYLKELEIFNRDVIGLNETGHATEAVVEWMENNK